jgi:hypothetical protein
MQAAAHATQERFRPTTTVLRVVGAVLLGVIALIHGYLWGQGYRDIDVIGPAFLLQTVLAVLGAAALLLAPRRLLPWVAAAGAAFAVGSLVALVLSTTVGLFGFVKSTAATYWWESFWVEAAAGVVLTALALLGRLGRR